MARRHPPKIDQSHACWVALHAVLYGDLPRNCPSFKFYLNTLLRSLSTDRYTAFWQVLHIQKNFSIEIEELCIARHGFSIRGFLNLYANRIEKRMEVNKEASPWLLR